MVKNPRKSWIPDSIPWILDSNYWIPDVSGTKARFRSLTFHVPNLMYKLL